MSANVTAPPDAARSDSMNERVNSYSSHAATIWPPSAHKVSSVAAITAIPESPARLASAPSRSADFNSSDRTVGLPRGA